MESIKQKIYDYKQQQKGLLAEINAFIEKDDLGEDYQNTVKAFDALQLKVDAAEKQLQRQSGFAGEGDPSHKDFTPGVNKTYESGVLKGLSHDTVKNFADGIRKAMNTGSGSDGGYTVPADIVTRVYELVNAEDNMLPYITNTPVTAPKGSRTYKARKQMTGLQTVAEMAAIPEAEKFTFAQIEYVIAKRAGYLPVSKELLEDSDEDIAAMVIEWLADEVRVTIALKTIATAKTVGVTDVAALEDILQILTEGLGSAIRKISTVHTNDSGLLWLLNLKNGQGDSLLQPKPNATEQMQLCVGPVVVPIKTWDNSVMPNGEGGKIPMIIGSLKEGIQRFDRKHLEVEKLTQATIGGINLAENDMVAFKGSARDDYQVRDAGAFRYCELTAAAG